MEDLEFYYYETKPYVLLALAVYSFSSGEPDPYLIAGGLLLLVSAAAILRMRFKHRRGAGVERLFYELQPYLYMALALYVFVFQRTNRIAVGSGMVLLFCAAMILDWRYKRRKHKS